MPINFDNTQVALDQLNSPVKEGWLTPAGEEPTVDERAPTPSQHIITQASVLALPNGDSMDSETIVEDPSSRQFVKAQAVSQAEEESKGNVLTSLDTSPEEKIKQVAEVKSEPVSAYIQTLIKESHQVEAIKDGTRAYYKQQDMLNNMSEDMHSSTSWLGVVADFGGLFLPANLGTTFAQAADLGGKESSTAQYIKNSVLAGEGLTALAEQYQAADEEGRVAIIGELEQFYQEHSAVIGTNSIAMETVIGALRDNISTPMRVMEDVFGVLDVIPVVGSLARIVRSALTTGSVIASAKMFGRVEKKLAEVVYVRTGHVNDSVNEATARIQKKVGDGEDVTPDVLDILAHSPAERAIDKIEGNRPQLIEKLKTVDTNTSDVFSKGVETDILNTVEKKAKQDAVMKELGSIDALKVQSSVFTNTDKRGHFNIDIVYGGEKGGWDVAWKAQLGVRLLGERAKDAEIVAVDMATKESRPLGSSLEGMTTPKFFINYKAKEEYNVLNDSLAEGQGGVGFWAEDVFVKGAGHFTSYFVSNGDRLNKQIMGMVNTSEDVKGALRTKFRTLLTPLTSLKHSSKGRVLKILEDGDTNGVEYSIDDLVKHTPDITEGEIAGYIAARNTSHALYALKNAEYRKQFVQRGMKQYHDKGGKHVGETVLKPEVTHMAVPIKSKPNLDAIGMAQWDLKTRTTEQFTQEMLDKLYASGGHLARMSEPKVINGVKIDVMVVENAKAMSDLPVHVLNYRAGHIHKYYNERWFVKERVHYQENGKPMFYDRALAAYDDHAKALSFQYKGEHELLPPQADRSLGLASGSELGVLQSRGGLFTSRGEGLKGMADGEASTEDIITSLTKDVNAVSHLVATGDVGIALEKRFKDAYGEFIGADGVFNKGKATSEAIEAYDILQHYKRIPTETDLATRSSMVALSRWLSGKGFSTLSKVAFDAADKSVTQGLRTTAYGTYIAMNPGKQLLLQGMQSTVLAFARPGEALKAFTQVFAFHAAHLSKGAKNYPRYEASLAKSIGLKVDEFRAMSKALNDTGQLQSLTNHTVLQATDVFAGSKAYKTGMARLGQLAGNTVKTPFNIGQKIGFQAGEAHNITTTWLMVHNRWKKENPGKAWQGNADLAAKWGEEVRRLSLNPNAMGGFKWQRGVLSVPTQFWGFQAKAWTSIIYKNPNFTSGERARMFAGILTAYGATGVMADGAWNYLEEKIGSSLSQETKDNVNYGVVNWMVKTLLDSTVGGSSDIAVSENLSVLTGGRLITESLTADRTPFQTYMGIAYHPLAGFMNAVKLSTAVMDDTVMDTPEKAWSVVSNFLSIFPVFSNAHVGIVEANVLKHIQKSTFEVGTKATLAEVIVKAATGIRSRDEMVIIDQRINNGEMVRELKDMGKVKAIILNEMLLRKQEDGRHLSFDDLTEIEDTVKLISYDHNEDARKIIMRSFIQHANISKDLQGQITKMMERTIMIGHDKAASIHSIESSVLIDDKQKAELLQIVDYAYADREIK